MAATSSQTAANSFTQRLAEFDGQITPSPPSLTPSLQDAAVYAAGGTSTKSQEEEGAETEDEEQDVVGKGKGAIAQRTLVLQKRQRSAPANEDEDGGSGRKKRKQLSLMDKYLICQESLKTPRPTQKILSLKFNCGRATIAEILKDRERYSQRPEQGLEEKKRQRAGKWPQLDTALTLWHHSCCHDKIYVSDAMLTDQGRKFRSMLDIQEADCTLSHGWVANFKKRANIRPLKLNGDISASSSSNAEEERIRIKDVITYFNPRNVFCVTEFRVFWRMTPNANILSAWTAGDQSDSEVRRQLEMVTVLLCTNADGSEKLRPIIVGPKQNPLSLASITLESLPADYKYNVNGWMKSSYFMQWLNECNAKFEHEGRQVLFILDGSPFHFPLGGDALPELSNIRLHYLPLFMTGRLNPMESGIIQKMRVLYKAACLQHFLDEFQKRRANNGGISANIISENASELSSTMTIKNMIEIIGKVWQDMQPAYITSAWCRTGTLPVGAQFQIAALSLGSASDITGLAIECGIPQLIQRLTLAMTVVDPLDFVRFEDEIQGRPVLTDQDFIDLASKIEESKVQAPSNTGPFPSISNALQMSDYTNTTGSRASNAIAIQNGWAITTLDGFASSPITTHPLRHFETGPSIHLTGFDELPEDASDDETPIPSILQPSSGSAASVSQDKQVPGETRSPFPIGMESLSELMDAPLPTSSPPMHISPTEGVQRVKSALEWLQQQQGNDVSLHVQSLEAILKFAEDRLAVTAPMV